MEHIFLHAWNVIAAECASSTRKLKRKFGNFENAWKYIDFQTIQEIFSENTEGIWYSKKNVQPQKLFDELSKDIRLIMPEDSDYPMLLKEIHHPPCGIYVRGELPELSNAKNFLSIVGTRKNSLYGESQTRRILKKLSPYPLTIVSGFADGIDMIAHEAAIENNLPTIAILAFGFHHLPRRKFSLAAKILEGGGAFISEYAPDTSGNKFTFPARNRIIAGFSPVTLVIEAPKSSGALITATHAHTNHREVFAIPADLDRDQSYGGNDLIQKQKAAILLHPEDILSSYHLQPVRNQQPELFLNLPQDQQEIYDLLSAKEPKTFSELLVATKKETSKLLIILGILEIDQRIKKTDQGYIILN